MTSSRKIQLIIEYDGTDFCGWQVQPGGRSVQQAIEDAIEHLTLVKTRIYGAGRTDAGVHARGQVAVFTTGSDIPAEKFSTAITSRLPKDVCVRESSEAAAEFDPRHDAKLKLYRYSIYAASIRPAIGRQYAWHIKWPLDFEKMQTAAQFLLGQHDFTSLSNQKCNTPGANNIRTINECNLHREGNLVTIDVIGRSFLYNMVRNIAGLLVDVGTGHFRPDEIPEIIAARERSRAGQGAPACGLCLEWIRYASPAPEEQK